MPIRHPLEAQVQEVLSKYGLIDVSDKVYIALSGGADSVALLRVMLSLGYGGQIEALHANFLLRGEESHADEHFVRELCAELDIPLQVRQWDTRLFATEMHLSIEMAARQLRYSWFNELRQAYEAPSRVKILVAHHADDQLETFFLNLSMGTGIRGLRGMAVHREKEGIIRPMLTSSRALILDYLQHIGQHWREDKSNEDIAFKRNLIRHRLLPILEELNPSFRAVMMRTMTHLQATEQLYLEYVEDFRNKWWQEEERLPITPLKEHPQGSTLLFELLRPYGFSREVCLQICHSLAQGKPGARFYSEEHILHRGSQYLELLPREKEIAPIPISIQEDGCCHLADGRIVRWCIYPKQEQIQLPLPPGQACFDYAQVVGGSLTLRPRRPGDVLYPFGMAGKKLLRRILIDGKYPQRVRQEARLLCLDDRPIWLVGLLADRRYRVQPSTTQVILFSVSSARQGDN